MRLRNKKAAAEKRREDLERELERIRAILSSRDDIEKAISFGSFARGIAGGTSDLDLIIVQRTTRRFMDRLDEIYQLIVPRIACDILVYTPEEFERLKTESRFVASAIERGATIHAA